MSRFRREAQAAAAIRSTHVVQTLDYGVDNGVPFIAMELLKGESLAQRLERVNLLSPPETGDILVQVARALLLRTVAESFIEISSLTTYSWCGKATPRFAKCSTSALHGSAEGFLIVVA